MIKTMVRAIKGFSFRLHNKYVGWNSCTNERKRRLPIWVLVPPPLPQRTSLLFTLDVTEQTGSAEAGIIGSSGGLWISKSTSLAEAGCVIPAAIAAFAAVLGFRLDGDVTLEDLDLSDGVVATDSPSAFVEPRSGDNCFSDAALSCDAGCILRSFSGL